MAKAAEATMPEMPSAIMSEKQKTIFQAVKTAAEPRRIESVEELKPRILMQVPEVFGREYPERSYRWGNVEKVSQETAEGIFQVVTRSNHSKIPEGLFDLATGAVMYQGQNILLYTWRDTVEKINKRVVDDFNMGIKPYEREQRFEAGTIERVADTGDGRTPVDLDPEASYDFGNAEDLQE